jgi:cytochrome c oxidase subunit 4
MSSEAHAIESHPEASASTFVWVWVWLVAITGVEVFLAYEHLRPELMLTILLGLSVIKAALIMSYFMHLKFEKLALVFWLVPALVFCICMMLILFFPDSGRLLHMRPH